MLILISEPNHPLLKHLVDDPVRPEIPHSFRTSGNRMVAMLVENDVPLAITCISFHDFVPKSVDDLNLVSKEPSVIVYYTIWSYRPGAGQKLLRTTLTTIKERYPTVTEFVTLSPKTDMARRFHMKNGAFILQENNDTVNYSYGRGLQNT